jgi:hypothetical protein
MRSAISGSAFLSPTVGAAVKQSRISRCVRTFWFPFRVSPTESECAATSMSWGAVRPPPLQTAHISPCHLSTSSGPASPCHNSSQLSQMHGMIHEQYHPNFAVLLPIACRNITQVSKPIAMRDPSMPLGPRFIPLHEKSKPNVNGGSLAGHPRCNGL